MKQNVRTGLVLGFYAAAAVAGGFALPKIGDGYQDGLLHQKQPEDISLRSAGRVMGLGMRAIIPVKEHNFIAHTPKLDCN